ncbi:hypothetical protein PQZ39_00520 [bacterium]|nr:hypothetical protein [bacterium]
MSKNAIIVTNINFDNIFKYTLPFFEKYSKKTGADLIVLDKKNINVNNNSYYNLNGGVISKEGKAIYPNTRFENLQAGKYFDRYDRIFLLDCDIIIKPNCPDYFTTNPSHIYVTRVDLLSEDRLKESTSRIKSIQEQLGDIAGWEQFYFNSGVMMISKIHKKIFEYDFDKLNSITGKTRIQNFFNWSVKYHKFSIVDMGPKFNFFSHYKSLGNVNKKDAHILHYTGNKGLGSNVVKKLERDSNYFLEKDIRYLL